MKNDANGLEPSAGTQTGAVDIEVMESVYARNEALAKRLQAAFTAGRVFCVNVMGAPGAGKTSVLARVIAELEYTPYIIEGDIQSDLDAQRFRDMGVQTVQINTGGACHLDSPLIERAAAQLSPRDGILFIENIGNLVCPAEFVIGEHIKLLIVSTTEGSDKPYKYPLAFEKADAVILNKWDLRTYVDFDEAFFMEGLRRLNPDVPVFRTSVRADEGFDGVIAWLERAAAEVIGK